MRRNRWLQSLDEGCVAGLDDLAVDQDVNEIRFELLQDFAVVSNDHDGIVFVVVLRYRFRYDADGIDVEARVDFIEHGQFRFEHTHLEDFRLFPFTAGEAIVDVAFGIGLVHLQLIHLGVELLAERHDALLAGMVLLALRTKFSTEMPGRQ